MTPDESLRIPKCAACSQPMPDPNEIRIRISKDGRAATWYCSRHPHMPEPSQELSDKIVDSLLWDLAQREEPPANEFGEANTTDTPTPEPLRGADLLNHIANQATRHQWGRY